MFIPITDVNAHHASEVASADKQKAALLTKASTDISILQDAVNLGMAADNDKSLLTSLQTYRVQLYRVNTDLAPNIEWPVAGPQATEEGGK
ncbi:tail fiber assembly protein [Phytobacter sp. V91]|uniref:tail fiber assembly protein n=1 Tax=Phytobacter sp. V91 TaxID=3369425 RepID=UPI003F642208